MSTHTPHGSGHGPEHVHADHGHGGHSRSEEDRIHTAKIVWVGAGALIVFLVAGIGTTAWYFRQIDAAPKLPIPAEVGSSKIGMVEQQLFELSYRGANEKAEKLRKLHGYGWSDRANGIAHMPIDRAMELAARGLRAPSTPQPAAPAPGGAL